MLIRRLLAAVSLLFTALPAQATFAATATIKLFERRSELLSSFWGRDTTIRAGVVQPDDLRRDEQLPVCYSIHGFGGSHRSALRRGPGLVDGMAAGTTPRMLYVFLDAHCPLGHHKFADSVDFRDFTGIDIYSYASAFTGPDGKPIQLMRRNGKWVRSIEQFVSRELDRRDYGGQFMSFNAVFSPRGEDGRPMPLFDSLTGAIDPFVAESWRKYDIGAVLRGNKAVLGELAGKLRVFVGTEDTFRLEGACYLLRDDLKALGSDAEIVFAEGRDHGTLFRPHEELWPNGLMARIYGEMRATFDASTR